MNFIKFLKKDKDARKIFGKGELKIIEKQLLGIALSQSEKNRLSRDIRKKLDFIKKAVRFEKEFELKKGSVVKELIEQAKETILKSPYFPKIKKIILFGSTVENERTFRSDIDVAVEFDKIEKLDAGRFRIYILGRVDDKIDVQVYNALPDKIKKEIDLKGRLLYERKNQ